MTDKLKLHFITGNTHKYEEVKNFIEKNFPQYEVVQKNFPLKELQADTLEEVAEFKLKSVENSIDPPYFIEDAGFFVDDVLKGFPGVYSSYVMKTLGYSAILKILKEEEHRKAHFEAVIGFMDVNHTIHFFKGVIKGSVATDARGTSGFGFDPIFIPETSKKRTFAEMSTEEKNAVSHRRKAMEKLVNFLSI